MQRSSAKAWVVVLIVTSLVATSLRTSGRVSGGRASPETLSEVPNSASPSPVALVSQYVQVDISYLRWLWWPVILYLFWGMAYVCDEYFVRTIDVISERFQIPDDVAGATLMALGCNGPEMALNTIAIFHPSSIGVGAVIGGEVFNVLVIIGTALLATPAEYLPLQLGPFSFGRDVLFYLVSVGLLYWVLHDGQVTRLEAAVLLMGALCYTVIVALSSRLSDCFSHFGSRLRRHSPLRRATRHGSLTQAVTAARQELSSRKPNRRSWSEAVAAAVAAAKAAAVEDSGSDLEGNDSEGELEQADPETVAQWAQSRACADPGQGSVLCVRVDVRNRLMDRGHRAEERYIYMREDALLVSTAADPLQSAQPGQIARVESFRSCRSEHQGGLVNQPICLFLDMGTETEGSSNTLPSLSLERTFSATPLSQLSRPLLNVEAQKRLCSHSNSNTFTRSQSQTRGQAQPEALRLPHFREALWEVIPLEDVLYCQAAGEEHFTLHVHQHNNELGNLITLEFSAKEAAVATAWVACVSEALKQQRRGPVQLPESAWNTLLRDWLEWLQFPVKCLLRLSIPNMDDPALQHWYPLAFLMSMAWLALFAYSVVTACDGIHADFGISVNVLGFTVAAAGTSFPNVFSGMVVARQGKTSMAVANALGANVQNVFLALAVPWTVQTWLIRHGPFTMVVSDLLPAVVECLVTLLPVVLVYLLQGSSLPRWAGHLFLAEYLVYLVIALGQESSGCATWPLC